MPAISLAPESYSGRGADIADSAGRGQSASADRSVRWSANGFLWNLALRPVADSRHVAHLGRIAETSTLEPERQEGSTSILLDPHEDLRVDFFPFTHGNALQP